MDKKINFNFNEQDLFIDDSVILQIEKNILSSLINNDSYCDDIFNSLNADDFSLDSHKMIFNICHQFYKQEKILDFNSISNFIECNEEFKFENYLNVLYEIEYLHTNKPVIKQYIDEIINASIKRKLLKFSEKISNFNFDLNNSKESLWSLEKEFLNITSTRNSEGCESIKSIFESFNRTLQALTSGDKSVVGVQTGYRSLDRITCGFQPGDLIVLAARPGIGKTALAINFCINAAKIYHEEDVAKKNLKEKSILMFSMEMSKQQVLQRMISLWSKVELSNSSIRDWNEHKQIAVDNARSEIEDFGIYIDDNTNLTISDIRNKIKQMASQKDLKLVVIDYLQLLKSDEKFSTNFTRHQEVGIISRTLKIIAREYNVPIISIAQLSRKVEERRGDSKRPILSDLRESGSIEQDADIVCFLNYAENNINNLNNTNQINNNVVVEFILSKNRNGATGIIKLVFNKTYGLYEELSSSYQYN